MADLGNQGIIVAVDGRRLTDLSRWAPGPAAAVVVTFDTGADDSTREAARARWRERLRADMAALGWPEPHFTERAAGADEVWTASAPIDRLYAAVALCEAAAREPEQAARLALARAESDIEGDPLLLRWQAWAGERGLPFLWCDDHVSVGFGHRAVVWDRASGDFAGRRPAPALDALDPAELAAVPVALITGTNGKTTTSRLLSRIARHAGVHVGATGTDGLVVDERIIERGDWTGPGGAREVLRDPRVELAVLEAARGGMLRRGLGTTGVDAAAVTNVSDDHLGEWGIDTVADMAEVKLLVAQAVRPGGRFVCFDDRAAAGVLVETLTRCGAGQGVEVLRFVDAPRQSAPDQGCPGRLAGWYEDATLVIDCGAPGLDGAPRPPLRLPAAEVPITLGGAAGFNVANALCAALLARGLGLPDAAIRSGLASFQPDATDSPGRSNLLKVNGATVLLDFGHNPDGVRRVAELASRLPAERRLVVVGQAGDRTDAEIRGLVSGIAKCRPDRWLLKRMPKYLRGREPGAVVAVLRDALRRADVPEAAVSEHASELAAVEALVRELRPGDLALVFVQADAAAALAALGGAPG